MIPDFTYLKNRYYFEGKLTALQAMHVGSGFEGDETDATFAVARGKPYLPGSSIRGALRSTVERILFTLDKPCCMLFARELAQDRDIRCLTVRPDQLKQYTDRPDFNQQQFLKHIEDNPALLCDVCQVFGSPLFASKIKITDAFCTANDVNARYGTGINRETGTVESGVLYSYEVVEKDNKFEFELIAENMNDDDLGILSVGLLSMQSGDFWVGAKSAAGLGRCKLELENIKYLDKDMLTDFLVEGKKAEAVEKKPEIEPQLKTWAKAYLEKE